MAIGDIGAALIDTLSIGNPGSSVSKGAVCHAIGDFFCAVWMNLTGTVLTLETFEVDTLGQIAAASQDTIDVPTTVTTWASLIKITDGVVALIFDAGDTGTKRKAVHTYSIDACGNFGACDPIDTQTLNTATGGAWSNILKTQHTDLFVCLYDEATRDLMAATLTIDSCGNISTIIETKEIYFDENNDIWPGMVWTGVDDFYAFTYRDSNTSDGFVVIWTIDSCGNFGCSATDTHEFELANAFNIGINSNDAGTLIVSYTVGAALDVKTLLVDACGVVSNGTKIDPGGSSVSSILRIDEVDKNVFFMPYATAFKSFTVDACDAPSETDSLTQATVDDAGRAVVHPGVDGVGGIVVGVGWDGCPTEFFAWTVGVETPSSAVTAIPWGPIQFQQTAFLLG